MHFSVAIRDPNVSPAAFNACHSITVGCILKFQFDRQKMEASTPLKLKVSAIFFLK